SLPRSSRLALRSPLRLRLPLRLAVLLGMETLPQLLAPRAAIPLLERLGRDLALDQQLRELPSLRLALDRHARTSAAPLPRKPRPLPDAARDLPRQPVPELPREKPQLAPMVRLVRDEVAQEVLEIGGEVLPDGPGHLAAARDAELDQLDHTVAPRRQRLAGLGRPSAPLVDEPWGLDAVARAERGYAATTAGVDVR